MWITRDTITGKDSRRIVKSHRTWLKVILNPVLRLFGYSIVSMVGDDGDFRGYAFRPYPKCCRKLDKGEEG